MRQGFQPLSDCRTVGLSDWRTVGLSDCRTVGLADCRTANCQQSTVNSQLTTVWVGRADCAATVGGRRD